MSLTDQSSSRSSSFSSDSSESGENNETKVTRSRGQTRHPTAQEKTVTFANDFVKSYLVKTNKDLQRATVSRTKSLRVTGLEKKQHKKSIFNKREKREKRESTIKNLIPRYKSAADEIKQLKEQKQNLLTQIQEKQTDLYDLRNQLAVLKEEKRHSKPVNIFPLLQTLQEDLVRYQELKNQNMQSTLKQQSAIKKLEQLQAYDKKFSNIDDEIQDLKDGIDSIQAGNRLQQLENMKNEAMLKRQQLEKRKTESIALKMQNNTLHSQNAILKAENNTHTVNKQMLKELIADNKSKKVEFVSILSRSVATEHSIRSFKS